MPHVDDPVKDAIESLTPRYDREHGDWDGVVRGAGRARRSAWLVRAAFAAAVLASAAVAVLAWPFSGEQGGVLERALAAVGDGPVLHVVYEQEWGATLVDLETGKRRDMHGERELWYDPARGVHHINRFGGVVEDESFDPPQVLGAYKVSELALLAGGYRSALESGEARLLGPGEAYGIPVFWIRVESQRLGFPDVPEHLLPPDELAFDVAVSRRTYEPVATRRIRDGKPVPDVGARIVLVEHLPEGSGDFTPVPADPLEGAAISLARVGPLKLERAARVMGRAFWAGRTLGGLSLAAVWKHEYASGYTPERPTWKNKIVGLEFFYGSLADDESVRGEQVIPDVRKPFVSVKQVERLHPAFGHLIQNYWPPEGSLLLLRERWGRLKLDGLYVAVDGSSEALIVAAARALRPFPSAGSGGGG